MTPLYRTAPTELALTDLQRDRTVVIDSHESLKGLAVKDALVGYYGEAMNHGRRCPTLDEVVSAKYGQTDQIDDRANADSLTGAGVD